MLQPLEQTPYHLGTLQGLHGVPPFDRVLPMGMLRTLAPGQTGFKRFQGTAAALFKAPDYPLEEYFPAEFALEQLGEHFLRNSRWGGP